MTTKKTIRRRISRRGFLKWTGIGVGGVALSTVLPMSLRGITKAQAAEITRYTAGHWTRSGCNMCGGQCSIDVYVENGVARKIEPPGSAAAPNSVANVSSYYETHAAEGDIGRLCCKGNSGIKSLYDPDRLQSPLRRVGPRGSDQFEPISWDEAIEEAARRLLEVRAAWGARSVVWFAEDHSFNHLQVDFCKAYGTPNFSNHSNLCDTGRKAHYLSTLGHDRPLADMEGTDLLFVWGWNFLSAIKWIHLAPIFTRARMNNPNFQFIYVDPVYNQTASKANQWIAPRPGTDGALALALCKRLIDAGAVDSSFITSYTLGYDEFVTFLNAGDGAVSYGAVPWAGQDMTDWAAGVTGIPRADIVTCADTLIAAFRAGRRICIDVWSGPGHHTNATQGGRAINCLNLLLGAVDAPGTMVFPLRNGPSARSASWGPDYTFAWPATDGWRADGRDDVTIPATYTYPDGTVVANPVNGTIRKKYAYSHGSGIYVEMRERMIEQTDFAGNPYPIKGCVVVFQNLMMSTPNNAKTEQAFAAMDFVLCVDTHFSETARWADIVIPGSHYLERFDFNAAWSTFRSVGLRQPAVESWIGGLTEANFFLELGAAMGFDGFRTDAVNDTDEDYNADEWAHFMLYGTGTPASPSPWGNQLDWESLKDQGVWIETLVPPTDAAASTPKGGTHYRKYRATKSFGAGYTERAVTVGGQTVYVVRDANAKDVGIGTGALVQGQTFEVGFGTSSRRAQFWDPKLAGYFLGTTLVGGPAGNVSVANDVRYHPLAWYSPPLDAPTAGFPLYFISWKEVEHTHSRTFNNPNLMEMRGENRLLVHTTLAASLGITEGDWVWVQTPYGLVKVRAHPTAGIQAETVGFVRGFGHWGFGRLADGKGAHDGLLLPGRAEIHSGQAVHKEVPCRIYREV